MALTLQSFNIVKVAIIIIRPLIRSSNKVLCSHSNPSNVSRCGNANCDGMLFSRFWCSKGRRKRSQHVTTKVMYILYKNSLLYFVC